jgi:hypothetical protein
VKKKKKKKKAGLKSEDKVGHRVKFDRNDKEQRAGAVG